MNIAEDKENQNVGSPPHPDAAPTVCELFGRNEVQFVNLWSWTNNIPLSFPKLKENLCIKTCIYESDKFPEKLREIQSMAESIDRLPSFGTLNGFVQVPLPLVVQIVAKKKADVIFMKPKDGNGEQIEDGDAKALVMGHLVVADESGLCPLVLMNEAVERFHSVVEVGDLLVLYKVNVKQIFIEQFVSKVVFPFQEHFVQAELKVDKYALRHVSHIPLSRQLNWKPALPSALFPPSKCKLWIPSEVMKVLENKLEFDTDFVDLVGVIQNVGQMKREEETLISLKVKDTTIPDPVLNFRVPVVAENKNVSCAHRWIKISDSVDSTSQPLSLKLMITADNLELQKNLVPGAVLVVTNCYINTDPPAEGVVKESDFFCSYFSQIYLNNNIEKYCQLMPKRYSELASMYLKR